jgi:hypothetical protein
MKIDKKHASGSSKDQKPASGGGASRFHTRKDEKKASGSKSFKDQQPASSSRARRHDMAGLWEDIRSRPLAARIAARSAMSWHDGDGR